MGRVVAVDRLFRITCLWAIIIRSSSVPLRPGPAARVGTGPPSLPNPQAPVVSDRRPGRPPQSSDARPATSQHGEPKPEQNASEPFEDRHNGAAGLGIP